MNLSESGAKINSNPDKNSGHKISRAIMPKKQKMRHLVSPQVSGGKWEAGLVLTYLRDRPSKVHSSALEAALTAQTDSTSAIWKPWRPFEPAGWRAVCGKRITAYIWRTRFSHHFHLGNPPQNYLPCTSVEL